MERKTSYKTGFIAALVFFSLFSITPQAAPPPQEDRVCVFEHTGFRGRSTCWAAGTRIPNLKGSGWNDRISSIRVFGRARIILYQDTDFRGRSTEISSHVSNLKGHGWNDRVSAIEVVGPYAGQYPRPGDWRLDQRPRGSEDSVCVYEDTNFRGRSRCWRAGDQVDRLTEVDGGFWNDRISSIRIIGRAGVTVYGDSEYRGNNTTIRSDVPDLKRLGFNDRISSFRVFGDDQAGGRGPFGRDRFDGRDGGACFYEHSNYEGGSFCLKIDEDARDLSQVRGGWNDRVSSIRVFGRARVAIFRDTDFRGESDEITSDVPNLEAWRRRSDGGSWGDEISSIQVR